MMIQIQKYSVIIPSYGILICQIKNLLSPQMHLTKENILHVGINENILSDNFRRIENQLKKFRKEVDTLKKHSSSIVDKLNQLDPFDQMEILDEPTEKHIQLQDREEQEKKQFHKEDHQISRILPLKNNTEMANQNSVTMLDMRKNFDEAQKQRGNCRKNFQLNESRETDRSIIQNNLVLNEKIIKDILRRLDEQEQMGIERDQRLEKLQNDNGIFRKNFGMKQPKKPKNSPKKAAEEEKKSQKEKSFQSQENQCEEEEQNFTVKLSKDLSQLRQHFAGKFLSIDNKFSKFNEKIQQESKYTKIKLFQLGENLKSLKQSQPNQNILTENLLKNQQPKPSQKTKSSHDANSRILNQTMESYRAHYEDKIIQIFQEMDNLKREYLTILEKINEENNQNDREAAEKQAQKLKHLAMRIGVGGNLSTSKQGQEKLKKQLLKLKQQHQAFKQEFNELMYGINTGNNQTRTLVIKPNQTKQDWKKLSQKIFKVRQELLAAIKEVESKIISNNDFLVTMNEFEVHLGELKIMLNKKMDIVESDKTTKRIENRLNNFIRQICEKEGISQEQDAMAVRQPWFCLSCDTELKNYSGKLSKTMVNEKFMGKKVNPESHMVRRNDNSRLPSLH